MSASPYVLENRVAFNRNPDNEGSVHAAGGAAPAPCHLVQFRICDRLSEAAAKSLLNDQTSINFQANTKLLFEPLSCSCGVVTFIRWVPY